MPSCVRTEAHAPRAITQKFAQAVTLDSHRGVAHVTIYVTAAQDGPNEKLLGAFRLHVNGVATAIGPGRGDVNVGKKNHTTYDAIDLTGAAQSAVARLGGRLLLALQCYHHDGSGQAIAELHVHYTDGTSIIVGTSATWKALDATAMFNPSSSFASKTYPQPLENMDAGSIPYAEAGSGWAWRDDPLFDDSAWSAAVEQPAFGYELQPKSTLPIELITGVSPVRLEKLSPTHYFFDFGSEMMGGLRIQLSLPTITAGETIGTVSLNLTFGEELCNTEESGCARPLSNTTVKFPMRTGNTFQNNWSVPIGLPAPNSVVFEQHEYYTFRYGELIISPSDPSSFVAAVGLNITAWTVRYPWVDTDSSFDSPNEMLNAVWALCSNTIKVTSLDTTTDSNTRERLPYEADGLVTGASRSVLQRNALAWNHHSYRHNLENPTWPTEWRQVTPLVAFDDYMATGDSSLATTYWDYLEASTQVPFHFSHSVLAIPKHSCTRTCSQWHAGAVLGP